MRFLSTLFPKRTRARTVVHAGPLLLTCSGGARALKRYLRAPRQREVFLLHHGQSELRDAARSTGITDIALEASKPRPEAMSASEMALALGAGSLDFSIDEPAVAGPDGCRVRELTLYEAEALARNPSVRPRIRAKLRAGCAALRNGVERVRIGDPVALLRGRATILIPDPAIPVQVHQPRPASAAERAARRPQPASACKGPAPPKVAA